MSIIVEKMWIQLSGDLYASFSFLQCCFDGGFFSHFLVKSNGFLFLLIHGLIFVSFYHMF